jgi:carbamate kinase
MKTATIAIGGNAISQRDGSGTHEEQVRNIRRTARTIADIEQAGWDIVLTHGNGPQVGNILMAQEHARDLVPPQPMDAVVGMTQGWIGYLLQAEIDEELRRRGLESTVVTVVTRVVVDARDPAFAEPTKPVGMFYREEEARKIEAEKGWKFRFDEKRGGWRRVVASPEPKEIVEAEAIRRLVFTGGRSDYIVIACGGGGIPVVRTPRGLEGVEAVVDKDLASAVLANAIGERLLVIATDIPHAYFRHNRPGERALGRVTLDELKRHYEGGEFPAGSMGPKVLAAIRFLERGGERAVICSIDDLPRALAGSAGTQVHSPRFQERLEGRWAHTPSG